MVSKSVDTPANAELKEAYKDFKLRMTGLLAVLDRAAKSTTDSEGNTAAQTALEYLVLKDIADKLEEAIKPFKQVVTIYKEKRVPEAFELEGVTTLNLSNGYRITTTSQARASIRAEAKEMAYQWLRDHEMEALISETVNASTLSATARQLLEEGRELPDELFNVHMQNGTSVTKTR
jgi:hypothetical protein